MRKITLGLLSFFWLPAFALASTNMVVDDANIVDPRSCEIESWLGDNGRDSVFYFAPVCQFGDSGVELTFAYERWRPYQQASQNYLTTQVKTGLGNFDQQRGLVAIALGSTFALDANVSQRVPQYYVNVPASYQVTPRTTVHANAGLLQDTVTRTTRATSGVGIEQAFNASVSGFAELFHQRGDGVNWQIGTHLQQLIPGAELTLSVLRTEFDSGRDHTFFVALNFRPRGW